jgi:hypothetical protein
VVAVACSAVLVNVTPAAASWANSNVTLLEFRDVCRDGIRFGGAVREYSEPVYEGTAIAVQPPPAAWSVWEDRAGQVMRTSIKIPKAPDGTTIDTGNDEPESVSHIGAFTLRYQQGPLDLGPTALNLQDGFAESNVNTADVTNCFLYAPIDVQPGASPNKVPIGHGDVSVAVLGTKIMDARKLDASTFRFGPKKKAAKGSGLRDVNGDKRKDLVLRFGSVAAGLKCSTKTVRLNGQSPTGDKLEASGKVVPTGCRS